MKKVYVYKGFERFWHWSQAGLILFLAFTGFEVHGSIHVLGFEHAALFHRVASWMLIGLIIFAIFWHVVTGEWRQYIPTTKSWPSNSGFMPWACSGGTAPHQKNRASETESPAAPHLPGL